MVNNKRVVLIGGPPGAGKTTLGRALASRLGWVSITGDDLITAAVAITTPESHASLHRIRVLGHVDYFTNTPSAQQIAHAIAVQDDFWPAPERVIRSRVAADNPAVIDWWLFSPPKIAALGLPEVASFWLHIDESVLAERERSNTDWVAEFPQPGQMLDNFMGRSLWRNETVRSEAERHGFPVLSQPGTRSTEDLVEEVLAQLFDG